MSFWKKILILIPVFIIFIDIIDYFFQNNEFIYIRSTILYLIFTLFIIKVNKIYIDNVYKYFLIFYFYILFDSLFNSTNLRITLTGNLSIFINTSFYLLSLNVFKTRKDLELFKFWLVSIPILFLINLIIFTGLGIGDTVYGAENAIRVGNLHHSRIYAGSLVVLISLIFIKYSNNKIRDLTLIGTLIIILVLSMRRTALLIIITGIAVYLISYRSVNVFKISLILIIFIISTYPLYKEPLNEIIEKRGTRIETSEEVIEEETRYLEVLAVTEKIFSFNDFKYSLFGTEFLNSFGTYSTEKIKLPNDRILHTDYAVILHGSGLIGLILYLIFLLQILLIIIHWIKIYGFKNDISIFYVMLYLSLVIVTISGSILNITFRTFYFIILGAINGYTKNQINRIKDGYSTNY